MKRKLIFIFIIITIIGLSIAGCVRDWDNSYGSSKNSNINSNINSNSNSSVSSVSTGSLSTSSSSLSETRSSTASSSYTREYESLLTQLDDLEKVLNELDHVTSEDVEIPTP